MLEFWINAMHYHMEDTLQETNNIEKFSSQVFIGQLYSETILNGLNIVTDVREWTTSTEEMRCLYKESWWCRFFMYEG